MENCVAAIGSIDNVALGVVAGARCGELAADVASACARLPFTFVRGGRGGAGVGAVAGSVVVSWGLCWGVVAAGDGRATTLDSCSTLETMLPIDANFDLLSSNLLALSLLLLLLLMILVVVVVVTIVVAVAVVLVVVVVVSSSSVLFTIAGELLGLLWGLLGQTFIKLQLALVAACCS